MWSRGVSVARQPGSITVVAFCSRMTAGPAIASPGRRSSRSNTCASRNASSMYTRLTFSARSGPARGANAGAKSAADSARPIASTAIASTTSALPGIRNPYCCR